MSVCDLVKGWERMTPGERYDALVEYSNKTLDDLGYETHPTYDLAPVPDGTDGANDGSYDRDSDTITYDPDLFGDDEDVFGAMSLLAAIPLYVYAL